MKKLLSAVTSAVMSASLVSGAFTSSVSAAGSFAAAQPNVSMGGVLDVAANKTAGEDVVFDFGNYNANAGSSVIVNVKVDTQGKAVSAMDVKFKVDSPLTVSEIVEESPAFETSVMTNLSNLGANFKSLDSKGEPMVPNGEAVFQFVVDIPANTPSGDYHVGFGDKCEVHKSNDGSKYTTSYTNGVITVKGTNDTPATTAATTKSNTQNTTAANTTAAPTTSSNPSQTSAPSKDGEIMFDFQNYSVKAGDSFIANVLVDSQGKPISAMDVKFKIDSPLKITEIVEESPCFETSVMVNMAILGANFKSLASNGDPMVPTDEPVFQLAVEVPANTPDGVYYLGFNDKNEVHKSNDGSKYTVGYKNGAITVGNSPSVTSANNTTANNTSSTPTQTTAPVADADVVFDFGNWTAKAGQNDLIVGVTVDSKGKPISAMDVKFKIDSPLEITEIVEESPAFEASVMTNMAILGANFKSLASNGDPLVPIDGEHVFDLVVNVPANTPDGVYNIGFNGKNEVHKSNDGTKYTVASKNGTITIGDTPAVTSATTSSTPTPAQTTTTTSAKDGEVVFDFGNYTVNAGEDVLVGVTVDTAGQKVAAMDVVFKIDSPLTIKEIVEESPAFETAVMTNIGVLGANFKSLASNGDPLVPASGKHVFDMVVSVPASTAAGTYNIGFGNKCEVVKDSSNAQYKTSSKNGVITVVAPDATTAQQTSATTEKATSATTEKATSATTAKATSATTAAATTTKNVTPATGSASWVIPTVNAKPGEKVTMNVVVKDSAIEVAGAQFNIKQTAPIAFDSAASGNAYATIVPNDKEQYYAFGEGVGKGVKAADGSTIITLTFNVPADCANGTYPVKWSNAFITDTNGNKITDKITLTDGAIVVGDTPVAEGTAEWVIPTVNAKPGEKVTMNVVVKDSAVEVAGAQFNIKQTAPITYGSSATGNAYAAIVPNDTEQYYAFGEGVGKGIKAADGATIITLTFNVPADCANGTYPVKWSNAFITDTNGNKITDKITLTDGAIVVGDTPVAEGTAEWVIPTVNAKPGEKVTMNVVVKDSAVEVAGAQFNIKQTAPITYGSSATGNAYATIVPNETEQYYAFGEGIGKGVKAAEGATIITLTFNVPADCADGTYPVKWSNAFITDTNGKAITDKITLTDGAIIVGAVTTTANPVSTTKADTTASTDVTTASTDVTDNPQVDTTAPVSSSVTTAPVSTSPRPEDTSVPAGAIAWVVGTTEAQAGDTVTISIEIADPNSVKLPLAGASFTVVNEGQISATGVGNETNGYNAGVIYNPTTHEFAFAEGTGKNVASENGKIVANITYKIDESCPEGTYPIDLGGLKVYDTNGKDITQNVIPVDGFIKVVKYTTSTTDVTTAPVSSDTTAPVTSDTTAPVTSDTTAPVTSDTTAPVTSDTTAPVTSDTTAPVTSDTTAPVTSDTTAPVTSDTTAPVTSDTTSPVTSATTAPVTSDTTAPGTTTTLPKGSVIWKGDEVEAAPGETVKVKFVVEDNGSGLPVAGAQFTVKSPIGNGKVDDKLTNGYGASVVANPTKNEYAFANPIGAGIKSEDGKTVIELEYTIPADCEEGVYVVDIDNIKVFDANGNDISDRVFGRDGKITVKKNPTIVTESTTVSGQTTAATTTTVSGQTTAETTTVSGQTTAETTTVSGQTTAATTTVSGQTTAATTTVSGQTTAETTTVSGQTTAETTTTVSGQTTAETTTTTVSGQTTAETTTTTVSGQTTAETTTTVSGQTSSTTSETTAPVTSETTAPVTSETTAPITSPTTVAQETETSTTTTTTGPIVTGDSATVYYTVETVPGYYFSHDTGIRGNGVPGGFDKGQVTKITKITRDKNGTVIASEELSLDNVNFNGYTPSQAYHDRFGTPAQNPTDPTIENFANNFAYDIPVYYGTEQMLDENGNPVTVKAYIGVKGDTNLDFIVDGRDASFTLTYYAKVSTVNYEEATTAISPAPFITGADDPLDDLAAFLSDVNTNEWSAENWKLAREERNLDGRDASGILTFYARSSAADGEYAGLDDQQLWDSVVPERHSQS